MSIKGLLGRALTGHGVLPIGIGSPGRYYLLADDTKLFAAIEAGTARRNPKPSLVV